MTVQHANSNQKTVVPLVAKTGKTRCKTPPSVAHNFTQPTTEQTHTASGLDGGVSSACFNPEYPLSLPCNALGHSLPWLVEFIYDLRSKGLSDFSILKTLKDKFPKEYETTKLHWEDTKRSAKKKGQFHDDFAFFLPVLIALGRFKPGSDYSINQVKPNLGYSISNIEWNNPSQQNSNKLLAPHNATLPNVKTTLPIALGNEHTVFTHWTETIEVYYPHIPQMYPSNKLLKSIRENLLTVLPINELLPLIVYTIEMWGTNYYGDPGYYFCNVNYQTALPCEPTLSSFIKYIEVIITFFGGRLNAVEGGWESKIDRIARLNKLHLMSMKAYADRQRREALDLSCHQKLGANSNLLYFCLGVELGLHRPHEIPRTASELLTELYEETSVTPDEYESFKFLYMEEFTEYKKAYLRDAIIDHLEMLFPLEEIYSH